MRAKNPSKKGFSKTIAILGFKPPPHHYACKYFRDCCYMSFQKNYPPALSYSSFQSFRLDS